MSTFAESVKATRVWFDENQMWISLDDGRTLAIPKICFPDFADASASELEDFEISGNGIGLHWESLDVDIYVPNLLLGYKAIRKNQTI